MLQAFVRNLKFCLRELNVSGAGWACSEWSRRNLTAGVNLIGAKASGPGL